MKVYAVKKGHQTGILDNWVDCQAATKGFSSPEFKSFTNREEAEAYLEDRDVWVEQVAKDTSEGYLVAFTDGSYDKNLKRYSYGVKFIRPDGSEYDICGYGSNLIHAVSFKVLAVDSLYDFSLLRIDDKVSIFVFSVAKEAIMVYLYLTVLVAELQSQLYVLAQGL
jgi:hypothetical protein